MRLATIACVVVFGCASTDVDEASSTAELAAAPTMVTVTRTAADRVSVGWAAVTGALKYYIYKSPVGGAFAFATTARAPATTQIVAGLVGGTEYCFQLRADDGTGAGAPSTSVCTGSTSSTTVTATQTQVTRVSVSWTAVAGATKYYVYEGSSPTGTFAYKTSTTTATSVPSIVVANTGMHCYEVAAQTATALLPKSAPGCTGGDQWVHVATSVDSNPVLSCGTKADGTLWCWGTDKTTGHLTTPSRATTVTGWTSIAIVNRGVCAR